MNNSMLFLAGFCYNAAHFSGLLYNCCEDDMASDGPKMLRDLKQAISNFTTTIEGLRTEQFVEHYPTYLLDPKKLDPATRANVRWMSTKIDDISLAAAECAEFSILTPRTKKALAFLECLKPTEVPSEEESSSANENEFMIFDLELGQHKHTKLK